MNRKELYEESVKVLTDAMDSGTLIQCDCTACAIGNLLKAKGLGGVEWFLPLEAYRDEGEDFIETIDRWGCKYVNGVVALKQLGYTFDEISRIEQAFEDGYNEKDGLQDVLTELAAIHEVDNPNILLLNDCKK